MPAVSAKQKKFMDAAAHNPEFAKKAGIPTSVAQEFSGESKGKKFGTGTRPDLQGINKAKTDHGSMSLFKKGGAMKSDIKQDKAMVKKAVGMHDKQMHGGKKTDMAALKKGGTPKKFGTGGAMTTTSSTQPVRTASNPIRTASNTGSLPPRPTGPAKPLPLASYLKPKIITELGPNRPRPISSGKPNPLQGSTSPARRLTATPPRPKPDGFRGLFKRPTATPPTRPGISTASSANGAQTPAKPGMKKGGGVEVRGKTKGKMVKMNRGGRAC